MKVDELASLITKAYAQAVDQGIFFAFLTARDVCVTTSGPFQSELVGPTETPSFHGSLPYVRYEITSRQYASNGGCKRVSRDEGPMSPAELGLKEGE